MGVPFPIPLRCVFSSRPAIIGIGFGIDGDQVNVFLTSMENFAGMNDVYATYFTHKPARSTVAVKELPKGVPVEIECIAVMG